jgi:hypothetical protein
MLQQPMAEPAAAAAGDMTRFGNPLARGGRATMPVAWWQPAGQPRPLPNVEW